MPIRYLDQKIRQAFSDAAVQYDVLTSLHKEIGRELIHKVRDLECRRILDVGMGTGWFTTRLKYFFPESEIVGIDFASGMIEVVKQKAEGFHIVQADAAAPPFARGTFDLIASNLSYQWVRDLEQSFRLCQETLAQDGLLCFTMFGHETFKELFESLVKSYDRKEFFIERLPARDEVNHALSAAGFETIELDYELIKVHFPQMIDLMKWIKDIGANRLKRDIFIGADLLERASCFYNEHFRDPLGIYATLEVLWVKAKKSSS